MVGVMKRWVKAVLHSGPGLAVGRRVTGAAVRILMYHRFVGGAAGFRAQCEHIRRCYTPVPMSDVAAWAAGEAELPPRAVAVTVDDGYRDFAEVAAPLLREFGIPSTVYIVTDFADQADWLWWDQAAYLYGQEPGVAAKVLEWIEMPDLERRAELTALAARVGRKLPTEAPAAYAGLDWQQMRELAKSGVEFGGHTRTHPILARMESAAAQRAEVDWCQRRLTEELGQRSLHFCYPNGRPRDFDENSVASVCASGFQTAVTTGRGLNYRGVDPYRLRRLAVGPDIPLPYFRALLAGMARE